MNIFINIYNGWTVYEWYMIFGSLLSIFLLINALTYYITKNYRYCISISLTYATSSILTILSMFIYTFVLNQTVSNVSMITVLLILIFITVNWCTLLGFYIRKKDSKDFSVQTLLKEFTKDCIRLVVIVFFSIFAVCIFLRGELLFISITALMVSTLSIYLNTLLIKRLTK